MPPPPAAPPSPIHAQLWAVRLGAALLVAFVVILGLAFSDNARRRQLETTSEMTAVGDTHYFQPPDAAKLPAAAATLDGRPLYLTDANSFFVRETHARRVARDPAGGVDIYALSHGATDEERQRLGGHRRAFLLKTGANEFVAVEPANGK